jgi:hypothetical protein
MLKMSEGCSQAYRTKYAVYTTLPINVNKDSKDTLCFKLVNIPTLHDIDAVPCISHSATWNSNEHRSETQ